MFTCSLGVSSVHAAARFFGCLGLLLPAHGQLVTQWLQMAVTASLPQMAPRETTAVTLVESLAMNKPDNYTHTHTACNW